MQYLPDACHLHNSHLFHVAATSGNDSYTKIPFFHYDYILEVHWGQEP